MGPFGEVLTAMITPFSADGAVDHGRAAELARHLAAHGSDGLVVAGTTGESPTLSFDEKVALFRTVVDAVEGVACKVVAGTGTYDTRESVELTKAAGDAGCDGVMAVTPYYSKPPQEGLFRHFTAIADGTDHVRPVLLYNIPGRTSRLIEVETLARLAEHPNIVAVKDAVESLAFTARTIDACGDRLAVYSGNDELTLPIMAAGGVGIVSVASHLVGPQIKRMVTAARMGDLGTATKLHQAMVPLFGALFVEPNPMPVKAALGELWQPVGEPRLPLVPAAAKTIAKVKEAVTNAQQG